MRQSRENILLKLVENLLQGMLAKGRQWWLFSGRDGRGRQSVPGSIESLEPRLLLSSDVGFLSPAPAGDLLAERSSVVVDLLPSENDSQGQGDRVDALASVVFIATEEQLPVEPDLPGILTSET